MDGLSEAIERMGGPSKLGKALGESKGVINGWKLRGRVPPTKCPEVEKLTGVLCEKLNDEVDWAFVREYYKRKTQRK